MNWTPEKIEATLEQLKEKSTTDPEFRKLAVENPAAAVEAIAGLKVPDFYKLTVVEADPEADQTIVLPKATSQALSDNDLDMISGGCGNAMTNPCAGGVM